MQTKLLANLKAQTNFTVSFARHAHRTIKQQYNIIHEFILGLKMIIYSKKTTSKYLFPKNYTQAFYRLSKTGL